MIIELHIIQNFAPSNLNRDDTNTPKDCKFGGFRRARISSQCIKRSVRSHAAFADAVLKSGGNIGIRTKRIKNRLVKIFSEQYEKVSDESQKAADVVIELLGFKLKDAEKTEYLLYLGDNEILEIASFSNDYWSALQAYQQEDEQEADGKKKGKKKKRNKAFSDDLKELQKALLSVISKNRKEPKSYAADIALFGRMVADSKNMNVDTSCQVAHAISTHKVEMEMDFFTAVDDLLPDEDSGSDMMGVVDFNSSCFYRYSLININKLLENLGMNNDLLQATVTGFIEASVKAIPTGMQNSMAAQNPPAYARVIIRKDGFPCSLVNAFQKPVSPTFKESVEEQSIAALNDYFIRLTKIYGDQSIIFDQYFNLYESDSISFDALLQKTVSVLGTEVSK